MCELLGMGNNETVVDVLDGLDAPFTIDPDGQMLVDPDALGLPDIYGEGTVQLRPSRRTMRDHAPSCGNPLGWGMTPQPQPGVFALFWGGERLGMVGESVLAFEYL